jgi:hypothetical protein
MKRSKHGHPEQDEGTILPDDDEDDEITPEFIRTLPPGFVAAVRAAFLKNRREIIRAAREQDPVSFEKMARERPDLFWDH